MKRFAYAYLAVAALVACANDEDDFSGLPIETQSMEPTPSNNLIRITGRVCVINDLRNPTTSCVVTGNVDASGFTVTSGRSATVTGANGDFTMNVSAVNPTVTVTGNGVVPTTSVIRPTPTLTTIVPGVEAAVFNGMLTAVDVTSGTGTGSIVATVTRAGQPVLGATAVTTPLSPFGPFFDGQTPVNWGIDGTGQRGVVWVPGLVAGTVDLSVQDALGGTSTLVAGIPVHNGGITILDTSFTTAF